MWKRCRPYIIGLVAGCMLTAAVPVFGAAVKQLIATEANYPIYVNGVPYERSADFPILNYEGSTYIPLRAVSELLGVPVEWNSAYGQVEIGGEPVQNRAFRNVQATGTGGVYTVTGEARVFEGTMNYGVSDGHRYFVEKYVTVNEGAPAWSPFEFTVYIPEEELPLNGTLTLELFEYSADRKSVV